MAHLQLGKTILEDERWLAPGAARRYPTIGADDLLDF
jgi:hypothetical protein